MDHFTPISALAGGALIGLSAAVLLLFNGRLAGVSGIVAGIVDGRPEERGWRMLFVAGLLLGGVLLRLFHPQAFAGAAQVPMAEVAGAGLLVGAGARWGGGCTSGHGICGNARLSPRSIVATLLFILCGMALVRLVHPTGPS